MRGVQRGDEAAVEAEPLELEEVVVLDFFEGSVEVLWFVIPERVGARHILSQILLVRSLVPESWEAWAEAVVLDSK